MGLPVIGHPTFSLILPSTKQQITFRPFLVKEEKILLIAQASEDQTDIVRAIKQVITNCITTPDIDVDDFTTFDLEYFFIKLRSKSVQNIINLSYRDREDEQIYDVEVDLETIEVKFDDEMDMKVVVSETTEINLQYPKMRIMDEVEGVEDAVDFNFAIMQACIASVVDNGAVFNTRDYTSAEVKEFLENLDVGVYQKIQEFIEKMPRVEHTISYTNSNGKKVDIVLRTLTDFFTLG